MVRRGIVALVMASVAWHSAHAQKSKPAKEARAPAVPADTAVAPAPTPEVNPPPSDSLEAISRRGRALAVRDSVAWLGSDAMTSLSLPADSIRRLIVRSTDHGWEVASGALTDDHSAFLISELAIPGIQEAWASTLYDSPEPDTGYFASAARAIEASVGMFVRPAPRIFVAMAIPDANGWLVYIYPAPGGNGSWPRGGDMRFRLSEDGRVVTESRRLHESITEYSVRTARPSSALLEREPLVSGDTPEDTDVFHVLQRRPAIAELMSAGKYRYRIDVDGTVRLLPNN